MIDTHCHLYLKDFSEDRVEVHKRAILAGVKRLYLPAIDSTHLGEMISLESEFPGIYFSMAGLHPCSVNKNYRQELDIIVEQLKKRSFIAIGEAGLDFYWDLTYKEEQYEALEFQAELALQYGIPLVLHTRNATRETIEVMKKFALRGLRGVFHCFGGSREEAEAIMNMGFMMGIGGVVTYKNAGLDKLIAQIGLSHVVLETDAPYLTPAPHRGKRNESCYLKLIADKIAEVTGRTFDEVDRITTANAEALFGRL
jgi:TatD DNase family protein